mmetsp:Transcript_25242/g.84014  ORF Transcript_25242/g.84014 Transcript_25242/m.84014 type:complete len:263 (+) Transcript_25242:398-1186(+)
MRARGRAGAGRRWLRGRCSCGARGAHAVHRPVGAVRRLLRERGGVCGASRLPLRRGGDAWRAGQRPRARRDEPLPRALDGRRRSGGARAVRGSAALLSRAPLLPVGTLCNRLCRGARGALQRLPVQVRGHRVRRAERGSRPLVPRARRRARWSPRARPQLAARRRVRRLAQRNGRRQRARQRPRGGRRQRRHLRARERSAHLGGGLSDGGALPGGGERAVRRRAERQRCDARRAPKRRPRQRRRGVRPAVAAVWWLRAAGGQ